MLGREFRGVRGQHSRMSCGAVDVMMTGCTAADARHE